MIQAIITGLGLGLLLAISVGPVIFAIIKQSLVNGHKAGFAFVAGVSFSDILLVTVCNLLTTLFDKAIEHQTAIAVVGSIFLLGMGLFNIFFKKVALNDAGEVEQKQFKTHQLAGIFASGFLMNTLNPGVFLFWLATTAQLQTQQLLQQNPKIYLLTVYLVCLGFVLSTDILKVLLAGKIRSKLNAKNLHIINIISGGILVVFALTLLWGVYTHKFVAH